MIDRTQARQLALEEIRRGWSVSDDEPSIADEHTREESFGWVFFYNSKRFHQTKEFRFRLAGNGPVVVDKKSGAVSMLGTVGGVEHQLAEFLKKMPNQSPEPTRSARGSS